MAKQSRRINALLIALLVLAALAKSGASLGHIAQAQGPTATLNLSGDVIPLGRTFETRLNIPAESPDALVSVIFSQGERQVTVPAFWMVPQQGACNEDCSSEIIQPIEEAQWRVRFTPPATGQWRYVVVEELDGAQKPVIEGTFTVSDGIYNGVVERTGRYFKLGATGTPFLPVGMNLAWNWQGGRGTEGYVNWIRQLAASGGNFARLYVDVPWFIGLGWRSPVGDIPAIQSDAWRLDTIMAAAEEYGVRLQLVLLWHQGYITYGGAPVNIPSQPARPDISADWFDNPHNIQRGGPFSSGAQFLNTQDGMQLFKKLLRYIVARWSASQALFAWELTDQLDSMTPADQRIARDWAKEMITYLRQIDPTKRLITVGLKNVDNLNVAQAADVDYFTLRFYQNLPLERRDDKDSIAILLETIAPVLATTDRPIILGEFSLNPWFEPVQDDPSAVDVQQTLWAAAFSGLAGANSWWWDTYLLPADHQEMLASLRNFSQIWGTANFSPVGVTVLPVDGTVPQPLTVEGYNTDSNNTNLPEAVYRITPDGVFPPLRLATAYLYSTNFNPQQSRPQRYIINLPVDTKVTIRVARAGDRGGPRLVVNIDGATVAELRLNPNSRNASLTIPLAAGEHLMELDNLGEEFLLLDSITFDAYVMPLRALALADRGTGVAVIFAQNRAYTWQSTQAESLLTPVNADVALANMPVGAYQVEFWDIFSGDVLGSETMLVPGVVDGTLRISLPPITQMLAVRAVRIAAPGLAPTGTPTFTPTLRVLPTQIPTSTPVP
jgi:Domain of unknown function (DUF5060)